MRRTTVDQSVRIKPVLVPRPAPMLSPWRSTRPRKPDRYKDYFMNYLVLRPVDSRIQAVNVLINSGVLNEADFAVACKMLQ